MQQIIKMVSPDKDNSEFENIVNSLSNLYFSIAIRSDLDIAQIKPMPFHLIFYDKKEKETIIVSICACKIKKIITENIKTHLFFSRNLKTKIIKDALSFDNGVIFLEENESLIDALSGVFIAFENEYNTQLFLQ